jgi:hypothetical protein
VVVRRKSIPAAVTAALLAAAPVFMEVQTTTEVSILTGIVQAGGGADFVNTEEGRVVFQAVSSRDVKALLEADASLTPGGSPDFSVSIPRAYVKVRFPWFRLTAGKTRLSWGRGFLYDAGDVIFGGIPLSGDLSASDPRDLTAWLVSPYVSIGDFSFIEGVFLPAMPARPSLMPVPAPPHISLDSVSAGARVVFGFPGIELEAGCLYDGETNAYKPYAGVQASMFFELYGAAGIAIPGDASTWDDMSDSLLISCGIFRLFDLEDRGSISVRAEARFVPLGYWSEAGGRLPTGSPGYGAEVFLETAYSPEDTISITARSIVSPVDLSGVVLAGISWGIYQGLTVSCNGFLMFGDEDDVYSWDRDGNIGITAGLKYTF